MTTQGVISTDSVERRHRFAFWQDLVCDVFVPIECRAPDMRNFNARMQQGRLADITVVEAWSDPIRARRTHRHAARCEGDGDDIILALPFDGPIIVTQRDRSATLSPGDFALYTSAEQHTLTMPARSHMLCLKIARSSLTQRLGGGRLERTLSRAVSGGRGAGALFSGLARALPRAAQGGQEPAATAAADHALDLLALALADAETGKLQLASSRQLSRSRLLAVIARHADDPDLSPERAAARAGVSIRHANRLLADLGTSLERAIVEQRLQHAHARLGASSLAGVSITQIAYQCGFSDASHFARTFRRRFGITPREMRRLQGAPD